MRSLIAIIFAVLAFNANAEEFKLRFIDPTQIAPINMSDWAAVHRNIVYDLYVNKHIIGAKQSVINVHSLVVFNSEDGSKFDSINVPVKYIFSYGVMDCQKGVFTMLTDWFTDKTQQVVYIQNHEFGEYVVELLTPNTARNDAYIQICKKGS